MLVEEPLKYQIFEEPICFLNDDLKIDRLLNALWKQRQASFISFKLKIEARFLKIEAIAEFSASFHRLISLPSDNRKEIFESSVFRIWYRHIVKNSFDQWSSDADIRNQYADKLNDLGRIIGLVREKGQNVINISGTNILLGRYTVDKWVAAVTPPTYTFPTPGEAVDLEKNSKYPLEFFAKVMETVLKRISQSWPMLFTGICKFVNQIIHLDAADFRSCSADRYIGVIFLTGYDSTLFEIEESLVHEFGHQILYNLMELDAIIINDGKTYEMPWSGSERDYYGYFHALFIYVLLITYFVKIKGGTPEAQLIVEQRIAEILEGCQKAVVDFDSTMSFTPLGVIVYQSIRKQIQSLEIEFNTIKSS